jgi:hypothetical protein
MLVGYFNRNTKQELDIPIGPNNRIEPGGPDLGQPTHFLTGRHWGVFIVKAPADLGTQKMVWTLVANGQTNAITLHLRPEWIVEPFEDVASKNTPPVIKFEQNGIAFTGPPSGMARKYTTTTGTPLVLTAWVTDEPPKLNVANAQLSIGRASAGPGAAVPPPPVVTWSQHRGPGSVQFDNVKPAVSARDDGKVGTTATFSVPGEYVLRLQANDQSGDGGGGFQCCWTNVHVGVTVKPRAGVE